MLWIGLYPDRMGDGDQPDRGSSISIARRPRWTAAAGLLDGYGDLGRRGLPQRACSSRPTTGASISSRGSRRSPPSAHADGLPVIYHGCGNVNALLEDFIEIGIDSYNPLEAKADMDAVALRRQYGHRLGICGNSDIRVWERGDRDEIRKEVLRKLNAAKGGGYIFQSDHSVASDVSGQTYDYIVGLVRRHGVYPLELGEYDEPL